MSDDPSVLPIVQLGEAGLMKVAQLAELGLMTASLLHELRQPLFAIKGLVEMEVASRPDGAERRLVQALSQIDHMEELLRVYGAPTRAGDVGVFDLATPAQASVELLTHRARQVDASLRGPPPGPPLLVRGREGAVRQIVINLVHNAIDAVDGCAARQIEVWVGADAGDGVVEVRDSGPGLPAALGDRVFEPFVTSKPVGRGTGLGLFIARQLAADAGGELSVAHTGADGTVLRLRVPRAG
ncbi:MAG TPA: ATP-binding protein [Myxococcota bacterium]|nr:ATP-binding protein [Myxococcota bacterium]